MEITLKYCWKFLCKKKQCYTCMRLEDESKVLGWCRSAAFEGTTQAMNRLVSVFPISKAFPQVFPFKHVCQISIVYR